FERLVSFTFAIRVIQKKPLPDWILARKIAVGHFLINHDSERRSVRVLIVQNAAAKQRHFECFIIIAGHDFDLSVGCLTSRRFGRALAKEPDLPTAKKWRGWNARSPTHTREGA